MLDASQNPEKAVGAGSAARGTDAPAPGRDGPGAWCSGGGWAAAPGKTAAVYSRTPPHPLPPAGGPLWRRMPDDAAQAAHELFAALRELDATGVPVIWVEAPPAAPSWDGVRDRLQRAAAAAG